MNQVMHHQVNQQLHVASVGSGAPGLLKTRNDCGHDLEMPLIEYLREEWAQLSSAQKTSICKRHSGLYDGGCRDTGRGGSAHKRPHVDPNGGRGHGHGRGRGAGPKSKEYCALAASVATLSQNMNIMAAHMGARAGDDDDAKPAADDKMGANVCNSALCKNPKKEKNDTRLCLMGLSPCIVVSVLLSLLSL